MLALLLALHLLINEVMPAPTSGPEWIELYNPTDADIDVSNWRIDDDTPGGTQTTIAPGKIVPAHGYLVVTLSSAILNNTGDSATLLAPDGSTVDVIAFGAMRGTESYARSPDGSADWLKSIPSAGTTNTNPTQTPPALPSTIPTASATLPPATVPPTLQPSATTLPTLVPTTTAIPTTSVAILTTVSPTIPVATDTAIPMPTQSPTIIIIFVTIFIHI